MPMIALIGSEAPGRIEWSLRAGAHAQLLKPVGDNGAYSALLIARDAFDAQKALSAEIADLKRLESALKALLTQCQSNNDDEHCPIIDSLQP